MKIIFLAVSLFISTIFIVSCNNLDSISPQSEPSVNISIIEFASTEVWLKVEIKNISLPAHLNLFIDDSLNRPVFMEEVETKLYVNDLLPNQNYNIKVRFDANEIIESNNISVKTLDTTSNDINWQAYEFTNISSEDGILLSVCVENDFSVWAAGDFSMLDSLGQNDSEPYGMVNWDGSKLNYYKVYCKDFGFEHYTPSTMTGVFETGNILYATSPSQLLKKENNGWQQIAEFMQNVSFDKNIFEVGGTGCDNLYCTGWNGGIFHITSQGWNEIDSHTSNQFLDLISYIDTLNGDKISLFVSTDWHRSMHYITKVVGDIVVDSIPIGVQGCYSIWTKSGFPIFICGPGVIDNKYFSFSGILTGQYTFTGIRGTSLNDIFTCNIAGEIYHYNGKYWKLFNNFYGNYIFYSISVKGKIIALIGDHNLKPVIVIGQRNF